MKSFGIQGAGLGLRRESIPALKRSAPEPIQFFELAPENWIDVGGASGKDLRLLTERYPFVCHGLSLSLGGPSALDELFLARVRRFMREHGIELFTEHLAYCTDERQLYELLPIPFTAEAVLHTASRIRRTQEILDRRIAIENVSFYTWAPINDMREIEFIRAVLEEADCWLHLDLNNLFVNSVNFGYDPAEFLRQLPAERVGYMHIAGHSREAEDLIIDTHGEAVADPVWHLLDTAYELMGIRPTLLERDFNVPPLNVLAEEVETIAATQAKHAVHTVARRA